MEKKTIGIIIGILGAAIVGTYFYLNRKPKDETTSTNIGTGSGSVVGGSNAPTGTKNTGTTNSNTNNSVDSVLNPPTTKGDEVYAAVFLNGYKTPTISTNNILKSFQAGSRIGTFVSKQDSTLSKVVSGNDIIYVRTSNTYKK